MAGLKLFPIGMQDFAQIRNNGYYYVDKTDIVYKMTHTSRFYFLSRPRRFGKSLLVSTLKCYFEAHRELFAGLAMEKLETEWKSYPVFLMSFVGTKYTDLEGFNIYMNYKLSEWEEEYGVENKNENEWGARFSALLKSAHEKSGREVVVLVDEYDAPLLDSMENPELQNKLKQEMRKFFSPLKDSGGILRFVFLTGISKFSQLTIFSELNNLNVITMDDDYAAICGITQEELDTQMQPEIQALADKNHLSYEGAREALKQKYDGYHFSSFSPDVYNPFSLINSLTKKSLSNFWFATGTPTILTKLIKKYNMNPEDFDKGFLSTQEMFDAPTETANDVVPMLYQSGYLTIKQFDGFKFILGFPNDEVRFGFMKSLLPCYATELVSKNDTFILQFSKSLGDENIDEALTLMRAFLSSVPYSAEKQDENHYKTLFYLITRLCTPYVVSTEVTSAAGRADVVIETSTAVYVFEFKKDSSPEEALAQIDSKGYLLPYYTTKAADGAQKNLYKIGANFDSSLRTLGKWKVVKE